ncbi:GcrA family cell cycle regulator [Devosia lacusdianchii]|uniref:GcrA family cell cycle regulator n=1 Tax=Devosia lacusdianchii TaxID=2917991 RepID=UPI001F06B79E|nr:GcrA family cell cycle regulator [Devosia sp. JXJ CY 41]
MTAAQQTRLFDWTDDAVSLLRNRWAEGASCSEIARELGGGLSRSAVIGKVTRLKLPARASTTGSTRPHGNKGRPKANFIAAKRKAANENGGLAFKLAQARKDGLSVEEGMAAVLGQPRVDGLGDAVPTDRQLIGLLDLTDRTCRWPFGDPGEPGFGFCGCRKSRHAGPYCPEHTAKSEVRR